MPQAAPYAAAKAGVNSLTRSMAGAWTRKGIRVNAIAVGAVRAASLTDDAERYGLDAEAIGLMNASGRLGEPEEIGNAVLFFASDAASFCSGQTLYVTRRPRPRRRLSRTAGSGRAWIDVPRARFVALCQGMRPRAAEYDFPSLPSAGLPSRTASRIAG